MKYQFIAAFFLLTIGGIYVIDGGGIGTWFYAALCGVFGFGVGHVKRMTAPALKKPIQEVFGYEFYENLNLPEERPETSTELLDEVLAYLDDIEAPRDEVWQIVNHLITVPAHRARLANALAVHPSAVAGEILWFQELSALDPQTGALVFPEAILRNYAAHSPEERKIMKELIAIMAKGKQGNERASEILMKQARPEHIPLLEAYQPATPDAVWDARKSKVIDAVQTRFSGLAEKGALSVAEEEGDTGALSLVTTPESGALSAPDEDSAIVVEASNAPNFQRHPWLMTAQKWVLRLFSVPMLLLGFVVLFVLTDNEEFLSSGQIQLLSLAGTFFCIWLVNWLFSRR